MYRQVSQSLVTSILAAILLSSCSFITGMMKSKEIAESAIVEFHNRLNAQQCSEIYEQSDNRFKQQYEKNTAINACKTINERLGQVKNSSLLGFNIQSTPTETLATLKYTTEFSYVNVTEEFVLVVESDQARIVGYNLIQ
ncbi:DUF4019 domain-containing protein [Pseudanabaena sp. FACHB-1998]|uniref:DUF4019 domain-containing protein n=1 Tax=Pseudanabaena sp. FACHB-1998 TaxID=2692858 RepID=UPI0016802DC1|nr:DUF4019 domain-containing protein [Pseudanabaena sp. FACHB-1998]MBD2179313.1 DUF4019 domain-containing protein [Pseudanabaena sp. FACHB-1998]